MSLGKDTGRAEHDRNLLDVAKCATGQASAPGRKISHNFFGIILCERSRMRFAHFGVDNLDGVAVVALRLPGLPALGQWVKVPRLKAPLTKSGEIDLKAPARHLPGA